MVEFLKPWRRKAIIVVVFDDLIGVHDDGDKEGKNNIDEEADEGVEIDSGVNPDGEGVGGYRGEGGEHVVTIDQGEETFRGRHQGLELKMIRAQDDPASKGEPNVEEEGTDEEPEHIWSRSFHCQYQDIVGPEEAQVSENPKPDQAVAGSQHETAHVPHVTNNGPTLDELLDDGAHDDQAVVGADHHVPQVQELASFLDSQGPIVIPVEEHTGLMF